MNIILAILLLLLTPYQPQHAGQVIHVVQKEAVLQSQIYINEIDNIVKLTNAERVAVGLNKLNEDPRLNRSAKSKACDMVKKNYWEHNAPDGTTPWVFIEAEGYYYIYAGENLAKGYDNDAEVMAAWMKSPGHKKNILNPKYKDMGVGRCGWFIVEHFGSKK